MTFIGPTCTRDQITEAERLYVILISLVDDLHRPDMTRVDGVNDKWDRFDDFESYDDFTAAGLKACRQVL